MRRVAPWVATALVGAGAAAAATLGSLGLPGQSPSAWVSQLLATTEAAGTARLVVTAVVTSASPPLHRRSRTVGVADLRRGDFAVTTTETAPGSSTKNGTEQVGLGRTLYSVLRLPVPPQIALQTGTYLVLRRARRGPAGTFGLGSVTGALALLTSPSDVVQVRRTGTGTVDHAPATRYQVVAAQRLCTGTTVSATTEVWVDHRGRLVRAEAVQQFPVRAPGSRTSASRVTITQTMQLRHFGASVTIAAPRPTPTAERGVSGSGAVSLFARQCR